MKDKETKSPVVLAVFNLKILLCFKKERKKKAVATLM